jgi:DNA-binding NarL/FixJ family response regulator
MNAPAAVALVERDPAAFDLVVTDFNMPGMSGVDLASRLAKLRPDLPVVIMSGYVTEDLRSAASSLGIRAVVQKERAIEELGAVIHAVLRSADLDPQETSALRISPSRSERSDL